MKKIQTPKIHIGRYIDPLSDFGFKLLFGSEPNKDLLIAFLNGLFKGRKVIVDLMYDKTEQQGPQENFRKSIFDLSCTGADGERFIIEMQRVFQQFFKDRAVYYTSKLIHNQGPKGNPTWDFKLPEVYLIALMDFSIDRQETDHYLHWVHLAEEVSGKPFYEKLGYIFIEIPNFNKAENELETDLDKWLYVLKNMANLQKIPVFLNKQIFGKLFTIAETSKLSKEEYMQYEESLMAKWDEYAILKTAKDEGRLEGREVGRVEGREEGRVEGREEGIEIGMRRRDFEFVKTLLVTGGFTTNQIAGMVNVSEDFVLMVKKKLE